MLEELLIWSVMVNLKGVWDVEWIVGLQKEG